MNINLQIYKLTEYAVRTNLIQEDDRSFVINKLLAHFNLTEFVVSKNEINEIKNSSVDLDDTLNKLTDYAFENGIIQSNHIAQRDLFDTKLMGELTNMPSVINEKFWTLYKASPKASTDYFYKYCQDINYIRTKRIEKDKRWKVKSKYGDIDISINLSKPEKDPKAIALAGKTKSESYPKCHLCTENVGYAGRIDFPARQNHRIIPIKINNTDWSFQYSPYVYYNEHCIILNNEHTPMRIDRATFEKLFDFVEQFPHYFIGSNADLPIVGGSILSHDHFQGGNYTFAMQKADIEKYYIINGYEDVNVGILNWPLSVIRLKSKNRESITNLAEHILNKWRSYTDEDAFIYAQTDGEYHNTITPIARMVDEYFELDLTLRNNITTNEHPDGVYHPHRQYHNIKKENIGLIEVMGLAILPARLEEEIELIKNCVKNDIPFEQYTQLEKHKIWLYDIFSQNKGVEDVDKFIKDEIGKVFVKVLEDAGVYKCNEEGRKNFEKFILSI